MTAPQDSTGGTPDPVEIVAGVIAEWDESFEPASAGAAFALAALHEAGWRIVRTAPQRAHGLIDFDQITDEWTPEDGQ